MTLLIMALLIMALLIMTLLIMTLLIMTLLLMTLLIMKLIKTVNKKHICNVSFNNDISRVFISIVVVSTADQAGRYCYWWVFCP
jgi:hypothetical protein